MCCSALPHGVGGRSIAGNERITYLLDARGPVTGTVIHQIERTERAIVRGAP